MKLSEIVGRYFATRKCASCGELLPYESRREALCPKCRIGWDKAKANECKRCGRAVFECSCMSSALAGAGAIVHHKLVIYSVKDTAVRNTVMFIKKNNNPRVAHFLAEQLLSTLVSDVELSALDEREALITFVPRSKKGRICYGFDQSELIAAELGKLMGIEARRSIRRVKEGKEQKKLGARARIKNAKTLYAPIADLESIVSGKRIILVDDIVTTGASMSACISYLVRARAREVICLSVAIAEDDK